MLLLSYSYEFITFIISLCGQYNWFCTKWNILVRVNTLRNQNCVHSQTSFIAWRHVESLCYLPTGVDLYFILFYMKKAARYWAGDKGTHTWRQAMNEVKTPDSLTCSVRVRMFWRKSAFSIITALQSFIILTQFLCITLVSFPRQRRNYICMHTVLLY